MGGRRDAPPSLVGEVAELLREDSPFGLMAMASGLIEATTPRPLDTFPGAQVDRPDGPSTFLSFATSGFPPMEALALAVATMHPDEVLAARLRTAVGSAGPGSGPRWVQTMADVEITGTWLQADVLGDGENVMVAWRWPDGVAATAFVYVDHNMGTLVKDAFVIPEDPEALLATYAQVQGPHGSTVPLDPATARARIAHAIKAGERTMPPFETDTWPSCRPMVEWLTRHMPDGGAGYERPDWPEAERERLLDDFAGSRFGAVAGLDPDDVRSLADPLVWFGCDYGPGDPLRWSPVSVEIVLADWYPRKVLGLSRDETARVPDVLAGFVRFAHDRTSIPLDLTTETLEAVERWRPDFLEACAGPGGGRGANAGLLARIAAGLDPDDADDADDLYDEIDELEDRWLDGDLDDDEFLALTAAMVEAELVRLVGGREVLETLTDAPLDDVAFDWSRVPDALRPLTSETLDHLDRWAVELFDPEVRTIARAVLAAVVAADPAVFNRSARTDVLAAAVLEDLRMRLTGRMDASERRGLPWAVATQKDLAAATGVSASTIGNRARTVANVVEEAPIDWPALLHSTQRREAIETRDKIAALRRRDG